jgi:hypothetical protein
MKYVVLTLLGFSMLAGCSNEPSTDSTASAPIAAPSMEAPATAAAPEASSLVMEYVWHKAGENFSQDALMEKIAFWNEMIDAGEYDIPRANILFPRQESEDFDFIWALMWPSVEARNAGWAYWNANDLPKWAEATAGILSYDEANAYVFELSRQREATLVSTGETYENEFNFCTYNEGKGEADFAAFQSAHTDFVNGYEAERGPSAYGYALLTPTFETDPMPDFVWLDLWASAEEKADGVGYFEGSELQAQLVEMATCNVVGFAGLNIRS